MAKLLCTTLIYFHPSFFPLSYFAFFLCILYKYDQFIEYDAKYTRVEYARPTLIDTQSNLLIMHAFLFCISGSGNPPSQNYLYFPKSLAKLQKISFFKTFSPSLLCALRRSMHKKIILSGEVKNMKKEEFL